MGSSFEHASQAVSMRDRDKVVGSESTQLRDDMQAVLSISRALTGKLKLEPLLGAALATVGNLVGAEGTSILLIDPDTSGMKFYIAEGPHSDQARNVPLPPGAGICGHVSRTGQALIVNQLQNDPRLYRAVDQATGMTTRNILAVPIRSRERLWGVLELINKQKAPGFDARDQQLAEVVAAETALALENAHLHGEIVRQERMAAIGQTVSGLAHCIKNILNGIRSGSAGINRALSQEDYEKLRIGWATVSRNNEMLGNLVLDMLALARESKPHPFPTDVNDLTAQICTLLTAQAHEKNINIECLVAPNLDEVMLDATHFYRSLLNLVSNALDACSEAGNVRVRLYHSPGRSRFTVSVWDNGEGISRENARKLFQEFFTTKGGRGTGLGLPVTKKLITQMNGTITFHSVAGRGTKFVVALPLSSHREKDTKTIQENNL